MNRDAEKPNAFERAIAAISPGWAARRARHRVVLAYYEAAKPDRLRKGRREGRSGDAAVLGAGRSLREQARHLEQNHDLARGALDILVQNTIGANGINPEPQPRTENGEIHEELARDILRLYRNWSERPEVTWQHDLPSAQRLAARTWFRDGEVFVQMVGGLVPTLDHGTRVPFSLELLEPDFVPFDYNLADQNVVMGVRRNQWGRPRGYFVYLQHPAGIFSVPVRSQLKEVPAANMLHLKMIDRIGQVRGVSIFAAVLTRLEDIKDYEESERIAAKVAASMAAYIKKGNVEEYKPQEDGEPRNLKFRPGMIFDDLLPGEEIGTIDTKRPNAQLEPHRRGQLRAAASGLRVTYSSLAKDYDGTFSSQRQELVEGWGAYQILGAEFVAQIARPAYRRFLELAIAAGELRVPPEVPIENVDDALWILPQMPWIDPLKEAEAWSVLEEKSFASGPEIVRRRGLIPEDVLEQERRWREMKRDKGIEDAAPRPRREDDDDESQLPPGRQRGLRRRA